MKSLLESVLAAIGLCFISAFPVFAQSNFFTNTQIQGGAEAFDPTNLVKHAGSNPIINGTPQAGVAPFFNSLGSGAITDNMFGLISSDDPGPDTLLGTGDDLPVARCGTTVGTSANGLPGLNCGPLRFDPSSQGFTLPSGLNRLAAAMPFSNGLSADFEASGDLHTGFLVTNDFTFNCPIAAPPSGCISASQPVKQGTTTLAGQAGSFAALGTGEQVIALGFFGSNDASNCAVDPCT